MITYRGGSEWEARKKYELSVWQKLVQFINMENTEDKKVWERKYI